MIRRAAATVVILLVTAVLIVQSRRARDTTPTSDTAVTESYTLLAAAGALDVGAYSRYQWHHPGPLPFYALVPFHQASGRRTTGLSAGALAINLAAFASVVVVLWRRAHPAIAATTAIALAVYAWRAAEALASPWNPHLAVLPFAALVVAAAAAASGSVTLLPLVAFLASLAAQSHVALLPSALVIGALAMAGLLVRDPARRRATWPAVGGTAATLALVWALPLREELSTSPGNITLLWNYFVTEPHRGQALSVALSAWSDMVSGVLRPDFYVAHGWPFTESPVKWAEAVSLAEVAALPLAALSAWRRGRSFEPVLCAFLTVASLLALWSATRAEEPLFDHAVFWIAALGALNLGMLAGEACARVSASRPAITRLALAGCAAASAAAIVAGLLEVERQVKRSFEPGGEKETAAALADDLVSYMTAHGTVRPVVRIDQDAWGIVAGVVVNLQKRGVPVAIEDDWVLMFSPAFADTGREDLAIAIVARPEHVRLSGVRGAETIASRDPIYAHLLPLTP